LLNIPKTKPFDAVEDIGVVIRTLGPERRQVHVGLLYKVGSAAALNLNLREHLDLRNEPPTDHYCWIQIDLDEINRRLLASLCALIATKSKGVPYGFTYNGLYFKQSGDYVPRDLGHGLTCATFIMAIFETYSVPVLVTSAWTTADLEDQGWQTQMVRDIAGKRGDFIAGAIAQHIGHPRFKPEHVTAGVVDAGRPLGREAAIRIGGRIMRDLRRLTK